MARRRLAMALYFVGPAVLAFVGTMLGLNPLFVLAAVAAVVFGGPRVYFHYRAPRRTRAWLLGLLDTEWQPPHGLEPTASQVLVELDRLSEARNWEALRECFAPDFARVYADGRRLPVGEYIRAIETGRRTYLDLRTVEETVFAAPAAPQVLWLRQRQVGHPKSGPPLDVTFWSRVTLTPDQRRVREIDADVVTHVG
jgi:hypothetical protein